jgi:ketosteroid isomerase-like protein
MAAKRGATSNGNDKAQATDPNPPEIVGSPWRVAYRREVDALREMIRTEDMEDREHFAHALWMVIQKGLSQKDFADHRGFRASTINRWVTGAKAPPPKRRPAIVRDAFAMLEEAIRNCEPVIMRTIADVDTVAPAAPVVKTKAKTGKA